MPSIDDKPLFDKMEGLQCPEEKVAMVTISSTMLGLKCAGNLDHALEMGL